MNTQQVKGAMVAYEDLGSGPAVLFLHCSSASHKEWLFAARQLAGNRRCLLPDLMGYGETSSQFDGLGRVVECRDEDIIAAMVEVAGGPVDIVAHSYGATAALEYASRHPGHVRSILAFEPVSFHLLKGTAYRDEWRQIDKLAADVIEAESAGQSSLSARHYMSFWIGRLRWMLAPRRLRDVVVSTMPKVAYDFSLLSVLPGNTSGLEKIDGPMTLVAGSKSPAPARAVVEVYRSAVRKCRHTVIKRAGHMMPFTHRDTVMRLVEQHLAASA
jgi:pimeloyl-ACP methyl ester carboxylesterase